MPALVIGLAAGLFCFFMVTRVKALVGYDDVWTPRRARRGRNHRRVADGGIRATIVNPIFGAGKPAGGLDSHWGQVGNRLVGVLIAWAVALVGTIVILKITDLVTGFRTSEDHEVEGLDISQHGEEAYYLES